jgi:hypothetical protein
MHFHTFRDLEGSSSACPPHPNLELGRCRQRKAEAVNRWRHKASWEPEGRLARSRSWDYRRCAMRRIGGASSSLQLPYMIRSPRGIAWVFNAPVLAPGGLAGEDAMLVLAVTEFTSWRIIIIKIRSQAPVLDTYYFYSDIKKEKRNEMDHNLLIRNLKHYGLV